jgi:hypothetical protein
MLVQVTVRVDGREVGSQVRELSGTAAEIEEVTREVLARTGRMVLEPAFEQIARETSAPCCCGQTMRNCGFRTIGVQTTCGEVPVSRRRYRCECCDRELYPADAQICCGQHRVTQPLAKRICQLATTEHFTRLPTLLFDQHAVTLSHEGLLQLVHDVGTAADRERLAEARRSAQRRIAPPAERPAPRTIYVSCDGIMYCTNRTEPDPDDPTRQRLAWRQMKVGCVYWQDDHERWHKQMTWGRESPEDFGAALWRLACRCGYQAAQEKIFAADGGSWCWDIHARYFGDATGILDWYHASEHVWDAAKQVAPCDPKTWAHAALDQLHAGGGAALLTWLKSQPAPCADAASAALESLISYIATKVELMNYPDDRKRGWQIGTGMQESTCKQLVGLRLKGPGMHWTDHGALAITALRAIDLNGHWHTFWKSAALAI